MALLMEANERYLPSSMLTFAMKIYRSLSIPDLTRPLLSLRTNVDLGNLEGPF